MDANTTPAPGETTDAAQKPADEVIVVDDTSDEDLWDELESEDLDNAPLLDGADRPDDLIEHDDTPKQPVVAAVPAAVKGSPDPAPQTFESLKAENERLAHRVSSEVGRVAASQRRIAELQKLTSAPAQQGRADTSTEKMRALAEDYPEVAGPVTEALDEMRGHVKKLTDNEQSRVDAAKLELDGIIAAEAQTVEEAHPGWATYLDANAPAFTKWADDQPRAVRESIIRNSANIVDSQAAADVISSFKAHMNPQVPPAPPTPADTRRQRQLAASTNPAKSTRTPVVLGQPDAESDEAIWNELEATDKAKAR